MTCECDIEAPDIHRFPWVEGLSTGPPGKGRHRFYFIGIVELIMCLKCLKIGSLKVENFEMKFKFENFELRFWKLDFEIKELSFTNLRLGNF